MLGFRGFHSWNVCIRHEESLIYPITTGFRKSLWISITITTSRNIHEVGVIVYDLASDVKRVMSSECYCATRTSYYFLFVFRYCWSCNTFYLSFTFLVPLDIYYLQAPLLRCLLYRIMHFWNHEVEEIDPCMHLLSRLLLNESGNVFLLLKLLINESADIFTLHRR